MPTPPMSDEELDDVVRRSAEAYPDEVPLGSWLRMEDKLNEAAMQQEVRQRVNRRVARLFALEVLLVALALLWWQGRQLLSDEKQPTASVAPAAAPLTASTAQTTAQTKRQQPQRLATTTPRLAPSAPAASLAQSSTAPAPSPSADLENNAPVYSTTSAWPKLFPVPVAPEGRAEGRFRSFNLSPLATPERRTFESDNIARYHAPVQTTEAKTAPDAENPLIAPTEKNAAAEKSSMEAATPATPTSAPALAAKPADSLAKAAAPVVAPVLSTSTDSLPPKAQWERPAYRLVVGVMGAPELTAVHTKELTRPGNTVGAIVEYRFTPRLRVRTGVFRTVKLYSARGSDYKPPADYWTWRVPVNQIDADCDILEIPLDLRYDLLQRPTYSLFASAGLTSLIMRNEEYTYSYDLRGEYKKYTWDYARGSNHPLSMLSLSVGYERALSGRWSAQAEPFLKLPLGGVGFGKIHLRSAGVSFGVKYGLLRPRAAPMAP